MSELSQLQLLLARNLREVLPASASWENAKAVKKLQIINQELDGVSPAISSATIAAIVAEYRKSRNVMIFRDLKNICYGAAMRMPDGWCVLGNEKLRDKLLAEVEQLDEPRKRIKCFQALLSSYFAFDLFDEHTTEVAKKGWEILRDWLAQHSAKFQRESIKGNLRPPGWFAVLKEHANLLTTMPCDRYGKELLRGDSAGIENARHGLSIPSDSWVMEEAIFSQMKAAVELRDNPFNTHLDLLLKIAQGQTEVAVSDLLKRRAIAMLVSRYARCTSKPEHPVLRDAAVAIIGNPWLKRTVWDAWVKKSDGRPDNESREMVNGWLKRRLITDFFAVLSEDGLTDQRRLNYWLRFEPLIEDLWLVLGPDAMKNRSKPFKDLRERSVGRLLSLENAIKPNDNAFIMLIEDRLIVEFGLTGNACYVYPFKPAPFVLSGKSVSLYKLKNKILGKSHIHVAREWESNFDQAIFPKMRHLHNKKISVRNHNAVPVENSKAVMLPTSPHSAFSGKGFNEAAFKSIMKFNSVKTEDCRKSGGALWVKIEQSQYPMIDQLLEAWDFRYKPGRGWWRE